MCSHVRWNRVLCPRSLQSLSQPLRSSRRYGQARWSSGCQDPQGSGGSRRKEEGEGEERAHPPTTSVLAWRSPYLPPPVLAPQQWPIQSWSALRWAQAQGPPPAPAPAPAPILAPPDRPPQQPKRIILQPVDHTNLVPTAPIPYQTLPLLLDDLNRLLCTPHWGRAFDFQGTCTRVVAVPGEFDFAKGVGEAKMKEHLMDVVWDVLDRTVVAFDVHKLAVHPGNHSAAATTRSAAIWMGGPDVQEQQECPCKQCEHLLTLSVMLQQNKYAIGMSIVVKLLHFAT
ncbi:hypothetical protein B0H12DRAFT_76845 [Mycena haematopus]|nr:hypothetical protein B0H12DRAFT_76845 [Mycena haematopus]